VNTSKPTQVAVAVAIVVLLAVAGYFWVTSWSHGQLSSFKMSLQQGYQQHPLAQPFVLVSHAWKPATGLWATTGTWVYNYTAQASGPTAKTAAEGDLSLANGYQVIATSPDVISNSSAVLHRDLITGNDNLTVDISASPGGTYAKGPVQVSVTLSSLSGQ
jgi:hypothetical protein